MSKLKKCICCFMSVLMVFSAVFALPAFAESKSRDLGDAKNELYDLIYDLEWKFIYGYAEPQPEPVRTETSQKDLVSAVNKVNAEVESYTTIEQCDEAISLLKEKEANLCVDRSELKFMLDYLYADYCSVGYYDEALSAEIKEVYENAQNAYNNGSDKDINTAYILMRNELNRLCATAKTPGDLNKDGKCDVSDITLMQKYFAKIIDLNTSQRFAANIDVRNNISTVTYYQKCIVGLNELTDYWIKKFEKNYFEYDLDTVFFSVLVEEYNHMYWNDRYYMDLYWWYEESIK